MSTFITETKISVSQAENSYTGVYWNSWEFIRVDEFQCNNICYKKQDWDKVMTPN